MMLISAIAKEATVEVPRRGRMDVENAGQKAGGYLKPPAQPERYRLGTKERFWALSLPAVTARTVLLRWLRM